MHKYSNFENKPTKEVESSYLLQEEKGGGMRIFFCHAGLFSIITKLEIKSIRMVGRLE